MTGLIRFGDVTLTGGSAAGAVSTSGFGDSVLSETDGAQNMRQAKDRLLFGSRAGLAATTMGPAC